MMTGPLIMLVLFSALLAVGAPVALVFAPPYVIGGVSGLLLGSAWGRGAKRPRPVIVAGTVGGALGGAVFWALMVALESTAWWHDWRAGRVLGLLIFCGLTIGCGLASGALAIRLRGAMKASRSTLFKEYLYFLLGIGAFVGGPLAARAVAAGDLALLENTIAAAANSAVIGSFCFFLTFRRCRWPLPIFLLLGVGLAAALVSGVLGTILLGAASEFHKGHGEAGGGLFFFGMVATGAAVWVVLVMAFLIGVWHRYAE